MRAETVFSVEGKVAFITGAAAGLGRAMATALAENGADLWLFDRDAAALEATGTALRGFGGRVTTQVGDVADGAGVANAIDSLMQHHATLDICIANAGISDRNPGLVHEVQDEDWRLVLDVNLNGVFHTARSALAVMQGQGHGRLITVDSMWGLAAPARVFPRPAYPASKGPW